MFEFVHNFLYREATFVGTSLLLIMTIVFLVIFYMGLIEEKNLEHHE